MISPSTIETILEVAQIEEVIQEYVTLKKRGVNYVGHCPFHDEKTPSFTVSPSKGIFKCFGCGKAGNSVKFLMEHEHLSYPEALRHLAAKFNIEIEEEQGEEFQQDREDKESLFIINGFAEKFFHEQLLENTEGRAIGLSYFKERGFREETIKKFGLGYSPEKEDAFSTAALKAGYKEELLKELGLVQHRGRLVDFFRGRVIFPIHNLSGKVIAFGARTLVKDKSIPKYLNSPESSIYHKSKILYGAYFAKNAIRTQDECLLVEGYTDVISLFQNGIENVVSSSGTSLTVDQIRLIKRYTPNITILYDGDAAGINAASRGLELVLEQGLNVKVVILPEGEDPDSFIQNAGTSAFREYVKTKGQDFIFFKAKSLAGEAKHDPVKKAGLVKEIVQIIAKIPDPITRSLYTRECSSIAEVNEQLLINEVNKVTRQQLLKTTPHNKQEAQDLKEHLEVPVKERQPKLESSAEALERDIMRLLLDYGEKPWEEDVSAAEFILGQVVEIPFQNPTYEQIKEIYIHSIEEEGVVPEHKVFINHENQKICEASIDLLTEKYEISKNWEKMHEILIPEKGHNYKSDIKSAVARFLLRRIMKLIDENKQKIKTATPDEDITILLQERKQLMEDKTKLAAVLTTVIVR